MVLFFNKYDKIYIRIRRVNMKCPKCKATIEDNSKYCDYCGTEIKENKNNTTIKKEDITTEEYYKNYIGDNYYNFKNKFNIFAFIFGGLYIFYRKQYLFGTIFILIIVSCNSFYSTFVIRNNI